MSGEFAGTLRERVRIEQRSSMRDGIGSVVGGYAHDGDVWAAVTPLVPGDLAQAASLSVMPRWRVTMRKREGISPGTRLTWRARYLSVRAVISDPQEPAQMQLTCEELR